MSDQCPRSLALLAGTAIMLLGGCATMDDMLEGSLDTVEFDCDGDRDIRVAYLDAGEEVRLFSGEDSTELRLVDTREGGRLRVYQNEAGTVEMLDNGEQVHINVQGKANFEDCMPDEPGYRDGGGAF